MSLKEIFKPEHFNKMLIILATAVVLVFIFTLGIFVGHEKARFSRAWGENYYLNIMGPGGGPGAGMMNFSRPGFSARSGLGQIININGNSLIIKDQSNLEKTILLTDKTVIIKNNQDVKISELKIDDKIMLIGRANEQGQIEPKFIRVLPEPGQFTIKLR